LLINHHATSKTSHLNKVKSMLKVNYRNKSKSENYSTKLLAVAAAS